MTKEQNDKSDRKQMWQNHEKLLNDTYEMINMTKNKSNKTIKLTQGKAQNDKDGKEKYCN